MPKLSSALPFRRSLIAAAVASLSLAAHAQQADSAAAPLESIQITGSWLGSGLQNSVKNFAGARTVLQKEDIDNTGAANICLLYTSPSPRDRQKSRMPSSA